MKSRRPTAKCHTWYIWNYKDKGALKELFRFNDDGTIQATLPNGQKMNVSQDQAGLYQLRMAVNDGMFFASRD